MHKNKIKKMISENQPVVGCIVNIPSTALVEVLGLAGYHFLFIDSEHSTLSLRQMETLILAAELRGTVPIVRVPENNSKTILRVMDMGAMGIIIPDVSTREEAEAAVRAAKYAPLGERGLATTRSADYGYGEKGTDLFERANAETMVIALIESKKGVENAKEILLVEGIDGCFIGTSDLSMSMGLYGNTSHPEVMAAVDKVLEIGKAAGKAVGIVVRGGESPKELLEKGFSMVFTNWRSLVQKSSKQFLDEALS